MDEGTRESLGTRAFQLNRFPWVFRGLQVPRNAHATWDRGHTINTGSWRTPTTTRPPWSSPSGWRPSLSHVCEDYYVHVCPFKPTLGACSAGRSRIYRFQRCSDRGNDVTRRNWSVGADILEADRLGTTSLFLLDILSNDLLSLT